jgi:hypothetical protein
VVEIEKQLSKELGEFILFALVQREEAAGKWDVLISAPWVSQKGKRNVLDEIVRRFQTEGSGVDLAGISRIAVLDPTDPIVLGITSAVSVRHGRTEITDCTFNNVFLKRAVIVTSVTQADGHKTGGPRKS